MADEEPFNPEFDLSGTHAFLFVDHVAESARPEEVVGSLRERPLSQVLYASTFVGDYQAFAHLRAEAVGQDGIAELQDLVEEVVRIGARCTYGVETHLKTLGAKRRSPGLIALTRMKVASGTDIVEARERFVEEGFERPPGFVGISLMTGEWGVLLQTTGNTVEDVYDTVGAVVAQLEEIDVSRRVRIGKTSTSFASGDRTMMRHPRPS